MKLLHKYWPVILITLVVIIFSRPFLFQGRFPIPADTIIGLYHPYRDLYADRYPNGVPFKNSLITDPVRQQYPWRMVAIDSLKQGQIPLWNPYTFAGSPLLANHQSAPFYPFNIIFFVFPFAIAWGITILLQPLLSGIFSYLYLRNIGIGKPASLLGGLTFSFSGFSIAWLEWGTIIHTALWLPLILLSTDKIFSSLNSSSRNRLFWPFLFTFSLISSFFAGHLQTFFYVFLITIVHLLSRWLQNDRQRKVLLFFVPCFLLFVLITAIQWIPMSQFILESARNIDQSDFYIKGWFIPWQHLLQFIVPDFFGNPATGNYWGEWNYAEFIGYIGILPLILALHAFLTRRDKKTFFYGTTLFISLIFALPTFLAKVPFLLHIPFLSTAQPTRLLFVIDFSLAMLAAFGLDLFIKQPKKRLYPLFILGIIIGALWIITLSGGHFINSMFQENILIVKNNLILPTIFFISSTFLLIVSFKNMKVKKLPLLIILLIGITIFDLLHFAEKFNPFVKHEYLFPNTKVIQFLKNELKNNNLFRIATTDSRILPPNFSAMHGLQTIDGYDPLYLRRYGELIAASERAEPNINPPFGFNRIITPHRYDSKIIDLLGVKYILSLSDISSVKLKKVFQEGQTRVYENKAVMPRTFFVKKAIYVKDREEAIQTIIRQEFDLEHSAVFEPSGKGYNIPLFVGELPEGKAEIISYTESKVVIKTELPESGFLVLVDSFYPTWHAHIYSQANDESNFFETKIFRTDYNFRGILVPKGKHTVEFYTTLL